VISVAPHKYFRRREDQIFVEVSINVAQAALGAEVLVPTPYGPEKLKVPSGTQSGTICRLRGKGAPRPQRSGKGDLFIIVHVATPAELSKEQKKLYEELRKSSPAEAQPLEHGLLERLHDILES
jgi:molecular chaperone DnaJ